MVWNEPGKKDDNQSNDKDPWSGRSKQEGPPDLDEAFKKIQAKFGKLLGIKKGKGSNNFKLSPTGSAFGLSLFVILIAVIWFLLGFYIIQPAGRGVILHLGKYYKTVGPGLHWIPRLFASVIKVNVQHLYTYTYPPNEDTEMLTKDENLVSIAVTIQYRIDNPHNFLFNVDNPIESLRQATASAMRQAIGLNNLDDILTVGREQIREEVKQQLVNTLRLYQSGIQIINVAITSARAPEGVREAFDDAIKAREDRQRYINQAEAYALKVEPIAQGQAQRMIEIAKANKQKVILQAKADTASYLAILPLYQEAPAITRERLYLEALEDVFKRTNKVLIDTQNNNNMFYIPLDKLLEQKKIADVSQQAVNIQSPSDAQADNETSKSSTVTRPSRNKLMQDYDKGDPY